MYPQFSLTLALTHACNLRCTYCYTGTKSNRYMSTRIGCEAIDRAVASLAPGGTLELGFFGGEPLLEAERIVTLMEHAQARSAAAGIDVALSLTTNGTVTDSRAWSIMTMPEVDLAISHDGLPAVHDRHRLTPNGGGTSERVLWTLRRLLAGNKTFRVVMVVRPDTVDFLTQGIEFLQELGLSRVEPSLDLWTRWAAEDLPRLERAIALCAGLWRSGLPDRSIGWFDEKAVRLARVPTAITSRCGFGDGEIAVAPSGRLYPCERLIGEDDGDSPMALPGHVLDGKDFLNLERAPVRSEPSCGPCVMQSDCNTICRCSNYVRTGDVTRPDGLLCTWNQACLNETAAVIGESMPTRAASQS